MATSVKAIDDGAARWRRTGLVLFYFLIMTIFMTWPAVLHLGNAVIGQLGDNMHFSWLMGWFDQAIFQEGRWPFFAPNLNYPEGWNLARSETTPLQAAMGLPFTWLGGPVFAYNVVALLSFFFSGLAAFYWTKRLTQDDLAALLSGTLFAFLPFRIAHYRAGHLNILGTMALPPFFMALFSILRKGRAAREDFVLGGISLGLISLTSQYYFYVTAVAAGFVGLGYLLLFQRSFLRKRQLWTSLGKVGLLSLPLVAIATYPYLQLAAEESLPDRTVQSVSRGSASLSDFLLPSTDHFLWGQLIGESFSRQHWIEGTLYVGALAAGLGLIAVVRARGANRTVVRLLVILAIVAGVLTLGTHFFWNEELVRVKLPGALSNLLGRESTAIPMPGYFLFQVLPFYAKMRTFKRTGALVLLATCTLAGLGAAELLKDALGKRRWALGVGLLALALLDFYPGPFTEFSSTEPRPVDLWLARQPGQGAVAEFPFDLQEEHSHVFYSLIHGKPILGGFFNAFPPPQYRRIQPVMAGFPDEGSIRMLLELDVHYVIVDQRRFAELSDLEIQLRNFGFLESFSGGDYVVFEYSRLGAKPAQPDRKLSVPASELGLGSILVSANRTR